VDVLLEEHTFLQPDVLFISNERLGIVKEEAIEGPPDLVVEVLSPSTFYKDLRKKMAAYAQFGVLEYWIVDPEMQTVEIYTRQESKLQLAQKFSSVETLESALLPGFHLAINDVF
jgi:Uma2 family endonuclease